MKASLLPNRELRSFKVKDTPGRLLHFGPENNALQGEIIAPNFLFGSRLHCCSNILGLATELQIDQKGVMFTVLRLSNTVVTGIKNNRTLTMLNRD
jgi:hypothetical protein